MKMTVYLVEKDDQKFVYALTKNDAISGFSNHWASDDYSIEECEIVEIAVPVEPISGRLVNLRGEGHDHYVWDCPGCNDSHETDLDSGFEFPLLLMCESSDQECFFIAEE